MIIELSEEYLPEKILFRDKQILQIKEVFNNYKEFGMGTNLLILGVTGSGKTSLIKKVMEDENNSIYVSCSNKKTTHEVLKHLFDIRIRNQSDVLEKTIEKLKKEPRILIFDEIDKIKDLDNLMNDLNTIYRRTMVPIIIITMKRDILDKIPSDAKKTLFFEKVTLPSYNSNELKEILLERLRLIKNININIKEGSVNFISAIASRQGSARVLMNITIRCIQKNNFSQEFIKNVYDEIVKQDWVGFVHEINETEKEFLMHLTDFCDYKKEVQSEALQRSMQISPARISQLISTFEKYGVISSRHENLGRAGGRRRFIKFISKEIYEDLFPLFIQGEKKYDKKTQNQI